MLERNVSSEPLILSVVSFLIDIEMGKSIEKESAAKAEAQKSASEELTIAVVAEKHYDTVIKRVELVSGVMMNIFTADDVAIQHREYDAETQTETITEDCELHHVLYGVGRVFVEGFDERCDMIDALIGKCDSYRSIHRNDEDGKVPYLPASLRGLLRGCKIRVEYYLRAQDDEDVDILRPIVYVESNEHEVSDILKEQFKEDMKNDLVPYLKKK